MINDLKRIKSESDRGNYGLKAHLFRELYNKNPEAFHVDSREGGVVGITHGPTGFRFHIRIDQAPTGLSKSVPRAILGE